MEDSETEEYEMLLIMCEDIEFLINQVSLVTQGKEEFIDNITNILSEMMEFYKVPHVFEHGQISGKDGLYIIHRNNIISLSVKENNEDVSVNVNKEPLSLKYQTIKVIKSIDL